MLWFVFLKNHIIWQIVANEKIVLVTKILKFEKLPRWEIVKINSKKLHKIVNVIDTGLNVELICEVKIINIVFDIA